MKLRFWSGQQLQPDGFYYKNATTSDQSGLQLVADRTVKIARLVQAGEYLQMDNIRVAFPPAGQSISPIIQPVTSTFTYGTNFFAGYAGGYASHNDTIIQTCTLGTWRYASSVAVNVNAAMGSGTVLVQDVTNKRVYRIIFIVGYGYGYSTADNFLSIERLFPVALCYPGAV